jgi:hypothetical protein
MRGCCPLRKPGCCENLPFLPPRRRRRRRVHQR